MRYWVTALGAWSSSRPELDELLKPATLLPLLNSDSSPNRFGRGKCLPTCP